MATIAQKYDLDLLGFWLDKGLCHGSGDGEKTVCVEQAVALCAGLPLSDNPTSCTAPAVRSFGLRMNDRAWSSPAARSKGLREFAFAQLGTAGRLDEKVFVKRVAELVIREIVPLAFRAVAKLPRLASHKEELEAAALECETQGTEASARKAQKIARSAAAAAAAADDDAYAAAYDDAAYAAAADDAAYAAYADAAYAAAYAAYAAAYAAYARSRYRDEMLTRVAGIAVRAIKEQMGDDMVQAPGLMPQTGAERHRNTVMRLRAGKKPRRWRRKDGKPTRFDMALSLQEDGKSYAEIAARMGLTWESARSAVRYAKLRWRLPGGCLAATPPRRRRQIRAS